MKRKIIQGALYIKYILLGHVFNPLWRDRKSRRIKRESYNLERKLYYLSKYVPFVQSLKPKSGEGETEDEKIFSIWFQGEENAPEIVKACYRSIREKSTLPLVVLDDKTLMDFVDLPEYILDKWRGGKIRAAHFADICRVDLVCRHGGVWMDSTDFMVTDIPQWIMNEDFFIYLAGHDIGGWYSFVQNCFFRGRKNNPLLQMWRELIFEYWKHEDKPADYFFHQILFRILVENNTLARELFERMPHVDQDATHTIWYKYKNRPFNAEEFHKLAAGAFFQKTAYRDKSAESPVPGSFADFMIHNKV